MNKEKVVIEYPDGRRESAEINFQRGTVTTTKQKGTAGDPRVEIPYGGRNSNSAKIVEDC